MLCSFCPWGVCVLCVGWLVCTFVIGGSPVRLCICLFVCFVCLFVGLFVCLFGWLVVLSCVLSVGIVLVCCFAVCALVGIVLVGGGWWF